MDFWNNLFGFSLMGDTPKLRPMPKPEAPQGMTWQLAPTRATAEMVAAWDAGMRSAQLSGCGYIEAIDVAYRQMLASAPKPTSEADPRQSLIETEAERDLLRAQLNKLRADHETLEGVCSSLSSSLEEWSDKMDWAYGGGGNPDLHVADIARQAYEHAKKEAEQAKESEVRSARNSAEWIEACRKKDDKLRDLRREFEELRTALGEIINDIEVK